MRDTRNVALVGAPNSGKSTLFNWLTQAHIKVVNYPGSTVEISVGRIAGRFQDQLKNKASSGTNLEFYDTPGVYSLFAKTTDEEVTVEILTEKNESDKNQIHYVVVVVDGTQLSRHLLIVKQIQEMGFPFSIAVTMSDLLGRAGVHFEIEKLRQEFKCSVVLIDGLLGGGLSELVQNIDQETKMLTPFELATLQHWSESQLSVKRDRLERLAHEVLSSKDNRLSAIYGKTKKWDRIFLHPFWGSLIFLAVMFGLFASIFWLAAPMMDLFKISFLKLGTWLHSHGADDSLWMQFFADGILSGFSAVLVFVPQIFLLFLGIHILEGTGYLARAATVIDQPLKKIGLSGRAFVPILSGFACAVPALMATRNLGSKREKFITGFIIPLMTCSARLPVYLLLISFLFQDEPAWKQALCLSVLYFAGALLGAIASMILHWFLPIKEKSLFMMELPLFRKPQWRSVLKNSWTRARLFVVKAGPMIFWFSVIIWVGSTFPNYQMSDKSERLETSYLAQAGKTLEPIFRPMGADWKSTVGILCAFAAREVFVSTLAILHRVDAEDEDRAQDNLLSSLHDTRMSHASAIGLLVFFMIALQCLSTVAAMIREFNSVGVALAQLAIFNVVAYLAAVGAFQLATWWSGAVT